LGEAGSIPLAPQSGEQTGFGTAAATDGKKMTSQKDVSDGDLEKFS